MARDPLIFAMANPMPEVMPEEALAVRPDAIIGTGRSDYPNQINNVLCFPFIFRGALDVGATTINEAMKLATVRALAALAHAEIPEAVAKAYGAHSLRFGRDYLIPKPFDPRLIAAVAPEVAKAAMDVGRRDAADRRPGGLPRRPEPLRLPLGLGDAAGVRRRQGGAQARRLRRGRGRARAARGAGGGRRGPGAAAAGRPQPS